MAEGLISRICGFSPTSALRTNEQTLVSEVLRVLQGLLGSLLYWDDNGKRYRARSGVYVTHLSYTSFYRLLDHFLHAASCLKLVEIALCRLDATPPPTLRAFSYSISIWLKKLRDVALQEETNIVAYAGAGVMPTLLGLTASLSSLCSGAEYLLQIVVGAVPHMFSDPTSSIPPAEMAVHILDHLYKKLDDVCLVQGGEEDSYRMLVYILIGTLLPYVEVLDSWIFGGTLDDPFEEMVFYPNTKISVDDADFWDKSYLFRLEGSHKMNTQVPSMTDRVVATTNRKSNRIKEFKSYPSSGKGKEHNSTDIVCPLFVKYLAHSIASAGKSLQLMRHGSAFSIKAGEHFYERCSGDRGGLGCSDGDAAVSNAHKWQSMSGFTLSEIFCLSLVNLIGHDQHSSRYLSTSGWCKPEVPSFSVLGKVVNCRNAEAQPDSRYLGKMCHQFVLDAFFRTKGSDIEYADKSLCNLFDEREEFTKGAGNAFLEKSFFPENPVMTVCQNFLDNNRNCLGALNLSRRFDLPSLDDEELRRAVYGKEDEVVSRLKGTNYAFGFVFSEASFHHAQHDSKFLDVLFPFPTVLPSFRDDFQISDLLPPQKYSTLCTRVLSWLLCSMPQTSPLPIVIMQECLNVCIKKQVDYIGSLILSKLIGDWRLMEELAILRAIYLLGSGDLLQHFLIMVFNKLDNGETWHDEFELNTLLQESLRNSADGMILGSPDLLVASIAKNHDDGIGQTSGVAISSTHKSHHHGFGIDRLDSLKFTYKVSWPLELIANTEAMKKYNQVMGFLLKVKRAKFVLDKARRWMWKNLHPFTQLPVTASLISTELEKPSDVHNSLMRKDKGMSRKIRKRHWLVAQKLLHFVDAFHQYVMDRVYHNAWRELCEGMAAAGSLDEVIEVHETYLLSIQRQCFVVPDKLWALIAIRIKSILELALDFHSVQQTLSNGGAVSAVKARCEMEVDRIEKQFDDCLAFLLRVLSFKLNVGHFPHLADLVTRINYNHFYMSDGGNLKMATGTETANSRLGKPFQA